MTAGVSRRAFMPLVGGALLAASARSAATTSGGERIPLWPKGAPGKPSPLPVEEMRPSDPLHPERLRRGIRGIAEPWMEAFPAARPNGAAMLVVPGGGYRWLSLDAEGYQVATRLNAAGISCFVLFPRLPGEGWADRTNVPNADAQRAMRLIRADARRFRIDPERVGVMGFSAGGHVCADLAARHAARTYAPVDAADRLSARPAVAAPIYPVVSMDPAIAHMGSREALLGPSPDTALERAHSADVQASAANPPTFLVHAEDDATVKVENSLRLRAALVAAGVPVEAHLFTTGGHGFGLAADRADSVRLWPDLFVAWAAGRGFLG